MQDLVRAPFSGLRDQMDFLIMNKLQDNLIAPDFINIWLYYQNKLLLHKKLHKLQQQEGGFQNFTFCSQQASTTIRMHLDSQFFLIKFNFQELLFSSQKYLNPKKYFFSILFSPTFESRSMNYTSFFHQRIYTQYSTFLFLNQDRISTLIGWENQKNVLEAHIRKSNKDQITKFNKDLFYNIPNGKMSNQNSQLFLDQTPINVYSNTTIINLMRSIQCTLTSLGLLDHFVVQNSFKVFVRTLRYINTQEGRINYTEREQQMYEQKNKNALIQRKHYEQQEKLGFQQIPIPPPIVIQDQLKQPEQTKKDSTNRKGQRKQQKLQMQPQIHSTGDYQKLKFGLEELMGLADRGLSQISQLQRDYSFEQMNKYLDMNQLEEIYDKFQRVKAAIDENEITQENLMNFTNLNVLCYEELFESIRGKCKMAPAKEEVQKRREKDKPLVMLRKEKQITINEPSYTLNKQINKDLEKVEGKIKHKDFPQFQGHVLCSYQLI